MRWWRLPGWLAWCAYHRWLPAEQTLVPDLITADADARVLGPEAARGCGGEGWKTPVILITAFGTRSCIRRRRSWARGAGVDKPFAMEDLCGAAEALVPAGPLSGWLLCVGDVGRG